jgi:hypothetical protein
VDKFVWIPYGHTVSKCFPKSTDKNIATLRNNIGLRLKDLGDYEGAKGLLEKALKSDEKNFGPDHPTTAVRYSNLATVVKEPILWAEAPNYQLNFSIRCKHVHRLIQASSDRVINMLITALNYLFERRII